MFAGYRSVYIQILDPAYCIAITVLLQMSLLRGLLWDSLLCESPVHPETMVLLVSYSCTIFFFSLFDGLILFCCIIRCLNSIETQTESLFSLLVSQGAADDGSLVLLWSWFLHPQKDVSVPSER